MTYDLGDVVALTVEIRDSNGDLANAGGVTCTITLPDATTTSGSVTPVTTGTYLSSYTPTQAGRHVAAWVATGSNATAVIDVFDVRSASDAPLVSLADVKTHLNITATTNDEELRRFIDAATDAAERYTGRSLRGQSVTETLDGNGTPNLLLGSVPVRSVTSVTIGGSTVAATGYTASTSGVLTRLGGSYTPGPWTPGVGNVTVTYLAGEASPPPAAVQAVLELVRHLWQTQRGTMPGRAQVGDDYQPGLGFSLPQRVTELLDQLRIAGAA